jgi:hypothetical protein
MLSYAEVERNSPITPRFVCVFFVLKFYFNFKHLLKYIFYVRSKFVLKNILSFSHWTHKCKQCLFFGRAQWRRRIFHKKANAYYLCYDNHFTPSEPLDMEIGPRFSDEEYNPSESRVRWLWGQKPLCLGVLKHRAPLAKGRGASSCQTIFLRWIFAYVVQF